MKGIPLTRGYDALVSDDDYEELSQRKWQVMEVSPGKWYATTYVRKNGKPSYEYMHRMILNAQKGEYVDHIDGNGLNNQRHNIRICTQSQNISNRKGPQVNSTTGYIGVYKVHKTGKFCAKVAQKGRQIHVGTFDNPVDAALARDQKARELHGEYAYLNFDGG